MSVLAAVDIGSNALRLAIGSVDLRRRLTAVESYREPIRLGADVFTSGEISPALTLRTIAALQRFKALLNRHHARRVRVVATSAVREARNRDSFIREIQEQTGLQITIISGQEEARLIHLAVQHKVNLKRGLSLLVDIGGGSIELSLVWRGDVVVSDSVKMGTVRLLNLLEERARGQALFTRLVRDYAHGIRQQVEKEVRGRHVELCVGTGGNIEALGELRVSLLGKRNSDHLTVPDLRSITRKIQRLSCDERISRLGLRPDRADVIVPAGIVLRQILEHAGVTEMRIPRVGLKDGLLIDMVADAAPGRPAAHQRQVLTYAREVGRRFSFDESHGEQVSKFAGQLFDATKRLHRLTHEHRLLLEVAALLHDIGHFVSSANHHKHSAYLLRATPFLGLSDEARSLIALIARYHRKSPPSLEHAEFADISPSDRRVVQQLAALLRIADGLDREHARRVRSIEVEVRRGRVKLRMRGRGDMLLERWAVNRRRPLFEKIFKVQLVLR